MLQPQKHLRGKNLRFLFYSEGNRGATDSKANEGNKESKSTHSKTNLNLHLLGIRGSIEILVPGRLREVFDLGTDRLTKGIHPIPQLHPIYLHLGYALVHVVEGVAGEQQAAHGVKRRRWAPLPPRHHRRSRCTHGPRSVHGSVVVGCDGAPNSAGHPRRYGPTGK